MCVEGFLVDADMVAGLHVTMFFALQGSNVIKFEPSGGDYGRGLWK